MSSPPWHSNPRASRTLKRATLVGERSYGKGTIQEWLTLPGDTGGFRLTVARWLTPKQRSIEGTGLDPDVPVAIPATTPVGRDVVLERALEVVGATGDAALLRAA